MLRSHGDTPFNEINKLLSSVQLPLTASTKSKTSIYVQSSSKTKNLITKCKVKSNSSVITNFTLKIKNSQTYIKNLKLVQKVFLVLKKIKLPKISFRKSPKRSLNLFSQSKDNKSQSSYQTE